MKDFFPEKMLRCTFFSMNTNRDSVAVKYLDS